MTPGEAMKLKVGDAVRALWDLKSHYGKIPFKATGRIHSKTITNERNGDALRVDAEVYFGPIHGVICCDAVRDLELP